MQKGCAEMGFISDELEKRKLPALPEMDKDDFEKTRKEIVELLSEHIYGYGPKREYGVISGEIVRKQEGAYGGDKIIEDHKITVDTPKGPYDLYAFVTRPKSDKPVPLFVIHHFPYVTGGYRNGQVDFHPKRPCRMRLPDEEIVDSGCAIAVLYNKDITIDWNDFDDGIAANFGRNDTGECSWGKIGYWAWAASRVLDHLYTYDCYDKSRICVVGHSRMGKTSLWTGAQDTRFTHVISNDSGCSGAAITRGKVGEKTADICGISHWFCKNYQKYKGEEATEKMPFDQHYLLAAMAGRKLYVGSASEDTWADPYSEYLACHAASPYFEALGGKGFIAPDRLPEAGEEFHEGDIQYHLRPGSHAMNRYDWLRYIEFLKA